jgi:N-acetylglutamate synthase
MDIVEMTFGHYDSVLDLMRKTPGIVVREADSPETVRKYLLRNPGLSFVAAENGRLIGCAMSGHDGRRGYLQHVLVSPEFRGRGIAKELVSRCLDGLKAAGILKIHIDVLQANDPANAYWKRRKWIRRDDIFRYSFINSDNENT